tara:strand:+ start:14797 stop:16260 length:1464 start_codon:yes stop_codon:yes gene_type:complete
MKALVIGDLILDKTIVCDVDRVAPEAPVAVGKVSHSFFTLGGAGNVANNLRSLGIEDVTLVGAVGADAAGEEVLEQCADAGFSTEYISTRADNHSTTVKVRYVNRDRKMLFRADYEKKDGTPSKMRLPLPEDIEQYDVIVLSDYDKGLFTDFAHFPSMRVITAAKEYGIPVIVDCKPANIALFKGASVITPNRKEARELVQQERPGCATDDEVFGSNTLYDIAADFDILNIVVTMADDGIAVLHPSRHEAEVSLPNARGVHDVTGAGDVVVAALAVATVNKDLARDTWEAMLDFANAAAGISVASPGTTSVRLSDVQAVLAEERIQKKICKDPHALVLLCTAAKQIGRCVVFTNGCFDLLHPGHVHLLREARKEGDMLIAAVNTDESVRALKGETRPVLPIETRMAALAAIDAVDVVIPFSEDTPEKLIRKLDPDVLVKGKHEDTCPHSGDPVPGADYVASKGGRVVFVDVIPGYSTTATLAAGTDA